MTKESLREYRNLIKEVKYLENKMEEVETKLYTMSRHSIDGMPKKNGKHDFTDVLVKLIDIKALYEKKWDMLIDRQKEIENAIAGLPSLERTLMRLRYLEGLEWSDICAEIGYEWAQTHRVHSKALNELMKDDTQ